MNALPLPIGPSSIQSHLASMATPSSLSAAQAGPMSLHNLLGGVARWFGHGSVNAVLPMQRTSLRQIEITRKVSKAQGTPGLIAACATNTRPKSQFSANAVRILRVREPGQARASVGRMLMSGRMVDVCAELDRLVAREAALH